MDGNLRRTLQNVAPLAGARVLDLGSGTGRIPLLLAGEAAHVIALDVSAAMLRENAAQRARARGAWRLIQGDMRALPLRDACVDVVTAGWALGHVRAWYADDWRNQIGRVLTEMQRVVVRNGALVVIETLTTGSLTPAPPTRELADYYAWLELEWGMARQEIRTDYVFESVKAAIERTEFFFGRELANEIRARGWSRVPEWTGVWSKRAARE